MLLKKNKLKNKKIFKYLDFCKNISLSEKFDYIYARFFLHAINEKQEYNFFKNCKKISKRGSLIFLEFRTTKDKLMMKGKLINKHETIFGHYRRFIDTSEFKQKMKRLNYKLIYFKVSNNFARFYNEKPSICRAILQNNLKRKGKIKL